MRLPTPHAISLNLSRGNEDELEVAMAFGAPLLAVVTLVL